MHERVGDEVREERLAGDLLELCVRDAGLRRAAEQLLHRVVTEERGEQAADRRQRRDLVCLGRRDAVALQCGRHRVRQRRRQPDDQQREEHADRQHHAAVLWKVVTEHCDDEIPHQHPEQVADVRRLQRVQADAPEDRGQRDEHDRRVERRHEHAQRRVRQRDPLVAVGGGRRGGRVGCEGHDGTSGSAKLAG